MKKLIFGISLVVISVMTQPSAIAGEVEVVAAKASPAGKGSFRFEVTLRHADAGWSHYADNWEILTMEGELLGRRVLLHPHDNEQPFTRSLGGVKIPANISRVRVRGHDKVHKYGGKELVIDLPGRKSGS